MTNMVAQMFHDTLGAGDPEFIGIQNPGGTRDSFNAGPITYREAAMTLPFANSLFTTEITGAQFTKVLEQQWQRTLDGAVPSRPFLQLGLSSNVSYTYDESLPEGSRITSVSINGKPIDPEKTYRVGSGSFLISGGDNFHELAQGTDTRDTGITDLSAWVGWVQDNSPLSPDYSKRGVSAKLPTGPLTVGGDALSFTFGQALDGGLATQSLDMLLTEGDKVSPPLANTEITAYLGDRQIGAGTVTEGVGTVSVQLPSDALLSAAARAATSRQILRFTVQGSGTDIFVPFDIETPVPPSPEPDPSASPTPKPTPTKGTPTSSAKPGPSKRPGLPSSGANR